VYFVATDPKESSEAIEKRVLNIARVVKHNVKIPVAMKLSPFFTSLANVAKQLDDLKVDGLVLFNRFYQPDIDIEKLEVVPTLRLSDSSELRLRLRWVAILAGKVKADLAVTGGVHTAEDALKSVMTGASAVQIVSVILKNGPKAITEIKKGMGDWLESHEYASLAQARGSMSLEKSPAPAAFERANYMKVLASWGK
jgi:dihydroorotate dehydrogenase (fumarate)